MGLRAGSGSNIRILIILLQYCREKNLPCVAPVWAAGMTPEGTEVGIIPEIWCFQWTGRGLAAYSLADWYSSGGGGVAPNAPPNLRRRRSGQGNLLTISSSCRGLGV